MPQAKLYPVKRVAKVLEELQLHFTNTSVKEELKRSDLTTATDSESLKQILQGYWIPKRKIQPTPLSIFKRIFS